MSSRGLMQSAIRGFTIVELMVVVVITVILAVIAAPRIGTMLSKQRAQSAAYEFSQALQTARSRAILGRRTVDLRATYPSSTINIWNGDKSGTPISVGVTTADQSRISKTSYYILETGTKQTNSTSGIADNRVTVTAKLSDTVVVNTPNATALIRFTPDSMVQVSTGVTVAPTTLTADQTFVISDSGGSNSSYTVTLNRFGGSKVQKN